MEWEGGIPRVARGSLTDRNQGPRIPLPGGEGDPGGEGATMQVCHSINALCRDQANPQRVSLVKGIADLAELRGAGDVREGAAVRNGGDPELEGRNGFLH